MLDKSSAESLRDVLQKHLEHDEGARGRVMPDPLPRSLMPDRGHRARDAPSAAASCEFVVEGREALPEVVQARLSNMEDQMYSGFLRELNLVWVSVDDTICLWIPRQPQDASFDPNQYDGPRPPPCSKTCKDYVLAVTLVRPDPNKEYNCDGMPPYFLAVALRECVQLFKLEVTDMEISVQDTAIEIPVESYIKCMVATPTGRLFVGCNDGCVYELHYDEDDLSLSSFWRPRKFRKTSCSTFGSRIKGALKSLVQYHETEPVVDMCFDPTRHRLYALTAKNSDQRTSLAKDYIAKNTSLHVYALSSSDSDGGMGKPIHKDSKTLEALAVFGRAGSDARQQDVLDKDVLSIHPVFHSESIFFRDNDKLCLVLVTGSGWRIYFSYDERLKLHLRREDRSSMITPPWHNDNEQDRVPYSQSIYPPRTASSRARCAVYRNGLFLLGNDTGVHCVARKWEGDNERSIEMIHEIKANQLIQDPHGASLELWQIEEMTTPGIVGTVRDIWGKNQGQPEWCQVPSVNEQWTQHVSPPRRFICIGAREVVILHRLQPWEKMRALASEELGARRGQSFEQPDDLPPEQKCASLLLWWVRAGGSPGGAKPEGSRLSQADHASRFLFRLASQHEGRPHSGSHTLQRSKPLPPALMGIQIAMARFLRPVWGVPLFEASSAMQPIARDWQRLASEVHLIFTFITQNEHHLRKMMNNSTQSGSTQSGRNVDALSFERMCEFVKVCKEVCALMAIITKNGLGTVVSPQESGAKETFRDAVVKLAPGHEQNQSKDFRDKLKSIIDTLIEQGTEADSNAYMQGGFGGGFGGTQGVGARFGGDRDLHPASRDRLIHDIEEQCPTILQPSETSKMRARKCLVYAREAIDKLSDRSRMMMFVDEGKDMYNRVSRELSTEDVRHMCDGFIALQEHLSALQVLLKRCSEKDRLEEVDAEQLGGLIMSISQLPDRSVFTRALKLCLEHRGLYNFKVGISRSGAGVSSSIDAFDERPVIDYVLNAVIRSADYMALWPILRKQECLRRQTHHAHQRLVEFLKSRREWDKLVDFYNEIGQFARAQETCDQQAHQPWQDPSHGPTLEDRVHWFRQAAKAASLGGRAHKQKDYDFKADLCDVQKRLRDTEYSQTFVNDLTRKIMSPQELFNTAINMKSWPMALEVMDVLQDAGIVQSDAPKVVAMLWDLMLKAAWDAPASDHWSHKWASVELKLVDIGRRYVDKPDLLPLKEVVEFLEKRAENQADGETRVQQLLRDMELHPLKLIPVYTQLHDSGFSQDVTKEKYFNTLIRLYKEVLHEAMQADGSAPLPLAALETDLNRLEIRNPNGAAKLQNVRASFLRLRDQRRENVFF